MSSPRVSVRSRQCAPLTTIRSRPTAQRGLSRVLGRCFALTPIALAVGAMAQQIPCPVTATVTLAAPGSSNALVCTVTSTGALVVSGAATLTNAAAGKLDISAAGARLINTGALTNNGLVASQLGGYVANQGSTAVWNNAASATLSNDGTGTSPPASQTTLVNADSATFNNAGTLTVGPRVVLYNQLGAFLNNQSGGSLTVDSSQFYNQSGATLTNDGTATKLTVQTESLLANSATVTNRNGATLAMSFGTEFRNEGVGAVTNTGSGTSLTLLRASYNSDGGAATTSNASGALFVMTDSYLYNTGGARFINQSGATFSNLRGDLFGGTILNAGTDAATGQASLLWNRSGATLINDGAYSVVQNDALLLNDGTDGKTLFVNRNGATFSNTGTFANELGATFSNESGGKVGNSGVINNSTAAQFINQSGGSVINGSGSFNNLSGGVVRNRDSASSFLNQAALTNEGLGTTLINEKGGGFGNEGHFDNLNGATLNNLSGALFQNAGAGVTLVNDPGVFILGTPSGANAVINNDGAGSAAGATRFENTSGASITNFGSFNNRNGAKLTNDSVFGNKSAGVFRTGQFTNETQALVVNTGVFLNVDGAVLSNSSGAVFRTSGTAARFFNFDTINTGSARNQTVANDGAGTMFIVENGALALNDENFANQNGAMLLVQSGSEFRTGEKVYGGSNAPAFGNQSGGRVVVDDQNGAGTKFTNVATGVVINSGAGTTFANQGNALTSNAGEFQNLLRATVTNETGATLLNSGHFTNALGATLINQRGGTFSQLAGAPGSSVPGLDNYLGGQVINRDAGTELVNVGTISNDGAGTSFLNTNRALVTLRGIFDGGNFGIFKNSAGATLTNELQASFVSSGLITNSGATIVNQSGATFTQSAASFGSGTSGASFENQSGGTVRNTGAGSTFTFTGPDYTAPGFTAIANTGPNTRFVNEQSASFALQRYAEFYNLDGAVMRNQSGGAVQIDNARFSNSSTVYNDGAGAASGATRWALSTGAEVSNSGGFSNINGAVLVINEIAVVTNLAAQVAPNVISQGVFFNESAARVENAGSFINANAAGLVNSGGAIFRNTGASAQFYNYGPGTNPSFADSFANASVTSFDAGTQFIVEAGAQARNQGDWSNSLGATLLVQSRGAFSNDTPTDVGTPLTALLNNSAGGQIIITDATFTNHFRATLSNTGIGSSFTNRLGAVVTNAGDVVNAGGAVFTNTSGGQVENSSVKARFFNDAAVTPSGQVVESTASNDGAGADVGTTIFFVRGGALLINGSRFNNLNGALLYSDGAASAILNTGVMDNSQSAVIQSYGRFINGDSGVSTGATLNNRLGATFSSGGILNNVGSARINNDGLGSANGSTSFEVTGGVGVFTNEAFFANSNGALATVTLGAVIENLNGITNSTGAVLRVSARGSLANTSFANLLNDSGAQIVVDSGGTFRNLEDSLLLNTGGASIQISGRQSISTGNFLNDGNATRSASVINDGAGTRFIAEKLAVAGNAGRFSVGNGATLEVSSGALFSNQTYAITIGGPVGGTLTNAGGNVVISGASFANNIGASVSNGGGRQQGQQAQGVFTNSVGSTITNSGSFANGAGGLLRNESGAKFDNQGDLTNDFGGRIVNDGGFRLSSGQFENRGGSAFTNQGDGRVENYALMSNRDVGTSLDNIDGAWLYNKASFNNFAAVLNNRTGSLIFNLGSGAVFDNYGYVVSPPGTALSTRYDGIVNNDGAGTVVGATRFINTVDALVRNRGIVNNINGALFQNDNSTVDNSGRFDNASGAKFENKTSAMLDNNGSGVFTNRTGATVTNDASSTIENRGAAAFTTEARIVNDGTIKNSDSATFTITSTGSVSGTGRYLQNGGVTINNGTLTQGGLIYAAGGILKGTGVYSAPNIVIGPGATLAPGNSPGTLTIDGNLDFSGTLEIEIASPTSYDVLNVLGSMTFDPGAKIHFLFSKSFAGSLKSFDFLNVDHGIYGFNNSMLDFSGGPAGYATQLMQVCDTGGACSFNLSVLQAVPEPGTLELMLLGLGLCGAGALRRRAA